MQVAKNKVVGIHYTISIESQGVIFSNLDFDAEEYVHGSMAIFPGVEKALEGHHVNEQVELLLTASNAYGLKSEKLIYSLKNELFDNVDELEEGSTIQIPGGQEALLLQKNKDNVLLDANHPLAGENLHYHICIKSIREATEAEIKFGRTEIQIKECSGAPGCC